MNGAALTRTIGEACLLALAVVGCGSGGGTAPHAVDASATVEVAPVPADAGPMADLAAGDTTASSAVETARSQVARVLDPQVSADDAKTFSADNAAFAFAAYGKLATATDNLVFSPISISVALAMTYAGAAGNTAAEMAAALHYTLPPARLHPAFDALDLALATRGAQGLDGGTGAQGTDGGPMRLRMINSVWGEKTYVLRGDYLDTLATYYGAGVNLVDFIGAPEPSRLLINDWVAQQTEDKIKDLIPQGAIDPATRLVLVNAIYFNAAWKVPFPPGNTFDRPFTRLDDTQVTVKMMSNLDQMPALATPELKAILLPYQDERLSLLVVVPEPGLFMQVEAELDATWLATLVAGLAYQEASYQIPRFKVDTNAPVKNALSALGMKAAFDAAAADFSGIDGTRSLFVADILHKAFIAVGEKGTEAAAATGVVLGGGVPPISVVANRPFFYFLRDEPTGAILFMGRIMDPSQ